MLGAVISQLGGGYLPLSPGGVKISPAQINVQNSQMAFQSTPFLYIYFHTLYRRSLLS